MIQINEFINWFKETYKSISSNYLFFTIILGAFVCGWVSAIYYNNSKLPETNIKAVRHFVEHPSFYKLDTLYRKTGDTLYIDTIKVNYK